MNPKKAIYATLMAISVVMMLTSLASAETKTSGNVTGKTFPNDPNNITWYWGVTTSTQAWPYIASDTRLWHLGSIDSSSFGVSAQNSKSSGYSGASGIISGSLTTQHIANAQTGGYVIYTSATGTWSKANWWRCGEAKCP